MLANSLMCIWVYRDRDGIVEAIVGGINSDGLQPGLVKRSFLQCFFDKICVV